MSIKISMTLVLASTLLMTACSFQKDPNKAPPATPEPVKIGMTKEELQQEIMTMEDATFPDRLLLAYQQKDEDLFYRILRQAEDSELNVYGKTGETALEILIRLDAPEWVLFLLNRGASPYKAHKGTNYTPLQMINVKDSAYDEIRAFIKEQDGKLFKNGLSAMETGISSLMSFYNDTRFPLNKEIDGKSLLGSIGNSGRSFSENRINLPTACTDYYVVFLKAIEQIEGLKSIQWETLIDLSKDVKSAYLLNYVLDNLESFERSGLLDKIKSPSVEWMTKVSWIFADSEKQQIEKILIENIQNSSERDLRRDITECETLRAMERKFPVAYEALKNKFDLSILEIAGAECLPGGKIMKWQHLYEDILAGKVDGARACDQ